MENESAREPEPNFVYCRRTKLLTWNHNGDLANVDRVFNKVGHSLLCLEICNFSSDDANDTSRLVNAVQNNCLNLLVIIFRRSIVQQSWMHFLASSETLEGVNFQYAMCTNDTFPVMKKLRQLEFHDCIHIKWDMINSALRNTNLCILKLETLQSSINYDFLPLQNLRILCLLIHRYTDALDSLVHLKQLLILKITAKLETINLDAFFNKMVKHGHLRELEMCNVCISRETFIALNLMQLKKLHITCPMYFHSPLNVHEICQTMTETMPHLEYFTLSINHNRERLLVEDIILIVERLKYLEVLDLNAVESNFYYPECQIDIPSMIASINEALKTNYLQKLKLLLPRDLVAELFDANGQIEEEYRPLISSKLHFLQHDENAYRYDDYGGWKSPCFIYGASSESSPEASDESSSEFLL